MALPGVSYNPTYRSYIFHPSYNWIRGPPAVPLLLVLCELFLSCPNCPMTSEQRVLRQTCRGRVFFASQNWVVPKIGGKNPKWMVYNGKPY